ncbi:hypothetical protein E2C06_23990 [Dankookia rubra]|uniref:Transposase DDE domain-containing protein n=1 Tax=Dankookia rubra TaxID=1442381 RepID=A0A4V3A9R5_9PROT|nr:hypothetical protein [Dankookia rubra]TDH60105.1 hypothetical protein E2C06_23990 [Dankookia rubra]
MDVERQAIGCSRASWGTNIHLLSDSAYHSNGLRPFLTERITAPLIPNKFTRKYPQPFNRKARNIVERTIRSLKDWRRILPPSSSDRPGSGQDLLRVSTLTTVIRRV